MKMKDRIKAHAEAVGISTLNFFTFALRWKLCTGGRCYEVNLKDDYMTFEAVGIVPDYVREFVEYIDRVEEHHESETQKE